MVTINPQLSGKKIERGFTLIEVLIALLILVIGLLGVAGVQLVSMQQTANANKSSIATMYAQDIAERIRANEGGGLGNDEIAILEGNLQKVLGPNGDVQINVNGDFAEIEVQWSEPDPFAESHSSDQSVTVRAKL